MSDTVSIQFTGGGKFDGMELLCTRDELAEWDGDRLAEWFGPNRQRFFYQSVEPYRDGDETVTMILIAIACGVGSVPDDDTGDDDDSYDGWLPVADRYDDTGGSR